MLRDVIAGEYGLNSRQVLVVGGMLEQAELRMEDLEGLLPRCESTGVPCDLQERGVAKSIGSTREVRYRLKIKGL